ncbi:tRNA dimethylallyltransferase [Entomortierella parvispora]|uniref:tRNA dimethylallyltransferase n=1 Tax=Entomortierella parvispora TaxID=205924 RepID=A0A9P3HLV3_9FUNG|nr:tRNA dimethylallyltransferase [Entomortierella parvispora]
MHAWRLISATVHNHITSANTASIFSRAAISSAVRFPQILARGQTRQQSPRFLNQTRSSSSTSVFDQRRALNRAMDPGVIAVIGTTGVGKSNLSIQLAKELSGEVINADTLQVYKGLDIITNKMPIEEREGVVHHLMDFLPMDQEYSVLDFKADALDLIQKIHERKHLPVVVGGTHYYVQSLLWRDTLLDTKKNVGRLLSDNQVKEQEEEVRANEAFLRDSDTATLYQKLKEVDPLMANKWHENDRRKITRSLQVFFETGECQSDLIKKQHSVMDAQRLRMPTCIFWVYSASDVLNARLDARVDAMIKGGLFDEIKGMRKSVGPDTDYERGIWQAIGYKEFDPYFTAVEAALATGQSTDTKELEALKKECTEIMKAKTRQYAKRQVLWIRNKLLPLCKEKDVKIFLLDATSLDTWKENVGNVAVKIAKDFFAGNDLPDPSELNIYAKDMLTIEHRDLDAISALESWEKKECEICTQMQRIMKDKKNAGGSFGSSETPQPVIIHGPKSWEQHLKSKLHRKMKTNKAEMERDGPNWWYWRAQEYKKRKREGILSSNEEIVGEIPTASSATSATFATVDRVSAIETGGEDSHDALGSSSKVRKTDGQQ